MQRARRTRLTGLFPALLAGALLAGAAAAPQGAAEAPAEGAWLGVLLSDAVDGGVQLVAVVPGGPAERHGLQKGDVVVQAGERPLADVSDLEWVLDRRRPGDPLRLQLIRSGRPFVRMVQLSSRGARVGRVMPAPEPPALPGTPSGPTGCESYGLRLAEVTPDLRRHFGAPPEAGLLVTAVATGRSAEAAGLRVGDVLVELGSKPVREVRQVEELLRAWEPARGAMQASLVRARQPRLLTLRPLPPVPTVPAPAVTIVRRPADDPARERALLERTIELEIERLQQRIEKLRRELARLQNP